jgi:hypothetical protein
MRKTQYLKSSFPTKKQDRLSYQEVAKICHKAGWRGQALVTAVAVAAAESGRDPQAYLSYLQVPGSPDSILPWERRAYATNIAWLKTIPLYPGPTITELEETLEQRKMGTKKPWLHIELPIVGHPKEIWPQCDFGLFQLNSKFQPITPNPQLNANIAYGMWKNRGFSPWVAFDNGNYAKYIDDARAAVSLL